MKYHISLQFYSIIYGKIEKIDYDMVKLLNEKQNKNMTSINEYEKPNK